MTQLQPFVLVVHYPIIQIATVFHVGISSCTLSFISQIKTDYVVEQNSDCFYRGDMKILGKSLWDILDQAVQWTTNRARSKIESENSILFFTRIVD